MLPGGSVIVSHWQESSVEICNDSVAILKPRCVTVKFLEIKMFHLLFTAQNIFLLLNI